MDHQRNISSTAITCLQSNSQGVEVDVSSRWEVVGDGGPNNGPVAQGERHGAGELAKRDLDEVGGLPAASRAEGLGASADCDLDVLLVDGDGQDVDGVGGAEAGGLGAALTPDGAAVAPEGRPGRAVPRDGLVAVAGGDGAVAGLVGGGEVGEDGAEGRVVVALDVGVGAGDDLFTDDVADVAGLAEVVPGDDLDHVGEEVDGLLPAVVPEGVAGGEPVFAVLGEIYGGMACQ